MMEDSSKNMEVSGDVDSIDLREEISKYFKYWPWLVVSTLVALVIGYIFLRYTPDAYKTATRIIIKDSKNPTEEEAVLSSMGFQSGTASTNLENELAIMKSRKLMTSVVNALNLNIHYFAEGQFSNIELDHYDSPVRVTIIRNNGGNQLYRASFNNNDLIIQGLKSSKVYKGKLGKPINLDFGEFIVDKNNSDQKGEILIRFDNAESTSNELRNRISISAQEGSSIVQLTIIDKILRRGKSILDQLVEEYNKDAIDDNNLIAENTAKFINERLAVINRELDSVELNIEDFKERNGIISLESEAQTFASQEAQYESELDQVQTQILLAEALKEELGKTSNELLPANLGFSAGGIDGLIANYNSLVLEKNKLLAGSSTMNPLVKELDKQIETLKGNILQSLERFLSNMNLTKNDLQTKVNSTSQDISTVPSKEREFRNVSRQQGIKESLFLFLLQRREESSISYGVETPKAKVVDKAFSMGEVSPSPTTVLLGAGFIGFLIPVLVIFGINYFDNKLKYKKDIEKIVRDIPVLGEIPSIDKNESGLIQKHDRSVLAEAFRILTTSMQYILAGIEKRSKDNTTIYVTSTVKGEGKTFTAFNLALTLCEGNNKVLIVGADLRNPQLQRYESGAKVLKGVSDYIVSADESIKDYINQSKIHNSLSIVTSGSIPPNPSELLKNYKVDSMFKELKGLYDYVIVDTAPAMLVADTFLINRFADLTLYVARAGYTEKNLLNFAIEAKETGKLSNVSFVLNDVKMSNFGYYGNKYGYTYSADDNSKKGILSRFKR